MVSEMLEKIFKLGLGNQIRSTLMMRIIFGILTLLKKEFAFMDYTLSTKRKRKPFRL